MNIFSYVTGFAVLVLIAGAGYFFTAKQGEAPSDIVATETAQNVSSGDSTDDQTGKGVTNISSEINAGTIVNDKAEVSTPKTVTVSYSKDGYSPTSLEIKLGDTVKWVSDGAPMWTASAKHPTHEIYPEFDQKNTGNNYEFTFTKAGTWKYHNHLSANHFGSITVK